MTHFKNIVKDYCNFDESVRKIMLVGQNYSRSIVTFLINWSVEENAWILVKMLIFFTKLLDLKSENIWIMGKMPFDKNCVNVGRKPLKFSGIFHFSLENMIFAKKLFFSCKMTKNLIYNATNLAEMFKLVPENSIFG